MTTTSLTPDDPSLSEIEYTAVEVETDLVPEYSLLSRLGAEIFGTFVLVFIGVGIALFAGFSSVAGAGLAVPLGFGIAVLGAASAVGHISGGHFNPAVSFGAAIGGRISWADLLPYWVAQILGGTLAAGILFLLIPENLAQGLGVENSQAVFAATSNGFADHSPLATASSGVVSFSLLQALIVEIVATGVFVGIILGVTDKRSNIAYAPAAIGLSLAVLIAVAAPVTNASLNPARSTATMFFSGPLSDSWALSQLWLFWVAPLVGAAIAGLIYVLATPAPAAVAEWPELEPETQVTIETGEFEEEDIDAIDALLSRKNTAASLPEDEAIVEEVIVAEAAVEAPEVEAAEVEAAEAESEGKPDSEPKA